MSCISCTSAPSLATTLTSNPSALVISTPHAAHSSPATSAVASLRSPWAIATRSRSPVGKPTVATTVVVVVASSTLSPNADFYQLALPDAGNDLHITTVPLSQPTPKRIIAPQQQSTLQKQNQQQQQPAHPQPVPVPQSQQQCGPPSPPSSSSDDDDVITINVGNAARNERRPSQHAAARDAPLPSMRRSIKPRVRRKPITRIQPHPVPHKATQNITAVTPPPSPPKEIAQVIKPKAPNQIQRLLPLPRKRAHALPGIDARLWAEAERCFISPIGTCTLGAEKGSAFCKMHSCQAILADRTLCGGPVWAPQHGRFCADGYHDENERTNYTYELILRAAAAEANEAQRKAREWASHLDFFHANFGEAITSPFAYNFESGTAHPSKALGPHANYERMWGAHADDKWWAGEWRLHRDWIETRRQQSLEWRRQEEWAEHWRLERLASRRRR